MRKKQQLTAEERAYRKRIMNRRLRLYLVLAIAFIVVLIHAQALGILTVSDMIFEESHCSAKEREQSFTRMMEVALEAI